MTNHLAIEETAHNGATVLVASGEVDLATAPQLESKLQPLCDGRALVVDLSNVTFMDSTGLRVLIACHEAAQSAGGKLSIVAAPGPVMRLFSITGVDEWLSVHDSRASAAADD